MRLCKERPRRAASGKELMLALAALDQHVVPPPPTGILVRDAERDESGALPAGHVVSWEALWPAGEAPSYVEMRRTTTFLRGR